MLNNPEVPPFSPGDRVEVVRGNWKGQLAIVQGCTRCYLDVLVDGGSRGSKPTAARVKRTSVMLPSAVEMKLPVSRDEGGKQASVETLDAAAQVARLNNENREMLNQINETIACQQEVPTNKPQQQEADLRVEERVRINWDREWRWGRKTMHMKPTNWEGMEGTVTKVTPCYVWVKMDGEAVLKKRKHNVTVVRKTKHNLVNVD
jgi:transcription antitermination factor NusG